MITSAGNRNPANAERGAVQARDRTACFTSQACPGTFRSANATEPVGGQAAEFFVGDEHGSHVEDGFFDVVGAAPGGVSPGVGELEFGRCGASLGAAELAVFGVRCGGVGGGGRAHSIGEFRGGSGALYSFVAQCAFGAYRGEGGQAQLQVLCDLVGEVAEYGALSLGQLPGHGVDRGDGAEVVSVGGGGRGGGVEPQS